MRRLVGSLLGVVMMTAAFGEGGEYARAVKARKAREAAAAQAAERAAAESAPPPVDPNEYLLELLVVTTVESVDGDGNLAFIDYPIRYVDSQKRGLDATNARAEQYGHEGLWICNTLYPSGQIRAVRVRLYQGEPIVVWSCAVAVP